MTIRTKHFELSFWADDAAYGTEVFKELYTGTKNIRPYITASFETEAVETFFRESTGKGEFCK